MQDEVRLSRIFDRLRSQLPFPAAELRYRLLRAAWDEGLRVEDVWLRGARAHTLRLADEAVVFEVYRVLVYRVLAEHHRLLVRLEEAYSTSGCCVQLVDLRVKGIRWLGDR